MSNITKRLLRTDRVRKVPSSFSWLDHRLIRDDHLLRLQSGEILLYFFLVLVGDHRGLSYYSLRSISRYLKLPAEEIETARTSLSHRGLIAYEAPLYQVLSIPQKTERSASRTASASGGGEPQPVSEILADVLKRRSSDG